MAVGLKLAGKNDFVRVQEDINDNLIKLDEAIDFNLLATLGIEYGGILNNTGAKVAGKAYYDTTGKKLYKCIANTSINYADAGYFEALSNNDLRGGFKHLKSGLFNEIHDTLVPITAVELFFIVTVYNQDLHTESNIVRKLSQLYPVEHLKVLESPLHTFPYISKLSASAECSIFVKLEDCRLKLRIPSIEAEFLGTPTDNLIYVYYK